MQQSSAAAAERLAEAGASGCTDVTGFGLIGHLAEMTTASKVHTRTSACAHILSWLLGLSISITIVIVDMNEEHFPNLASIRGAEATWLLEVKRHEVDRTVASCACLEAPIADCDQACHLNGICNTCLQLQNCRGDQAMCCQ